MEEIDKTMYENDPRLQKISESFDSDKMDVSKTTTHNSEPEWHYDGDVFHGYHKLHSKCRYIHDDHWGFLCGKSLDGRYNIIGFNDDFGCVKEFNIAKISYAPIYKTYRFAAVDKTVFKN